MARLKQRVLGGEEMSCPALDYWDTPLDYRETPLPPAALTPVALAAHSCAMMLDDWDNAQRTNNGRLRRQLDVKRVLAMLSQPMIAANAGAVVLRLTDLSAHIRFAALLSLNRLDQAELSVHAGAIFARLEDKDRIVRLMARDILAQFDPAALMKASTRIVALQESKHDEVREWAIGVIEALYAPGGAGARAAEDHFERHFERLVVLARGRHSVHIISDMNVRAPRQARRLAAWWCW